MIVFVNTMQSQTPYPYRFKPIQTVDSKGNNLVPSSNDYGWKWCRKHNDTTLCHNVGGFYWHVF